MKTLSLADRLLRITVSCRNCGGRIRFPLHKGTIRIICPHCRTWFVFSLRPAAVLAFIRKRVTALFRTSGAASGIFTANPGRMERSPYVKQVMTGLLLAVVLAVVSLNICDSRYRNLPADGVRVKKMNVPAGAYVTAYAAVVCRVPRR